MVHFINTTLQQFINTIDSHIFINFIFKTKSQLQNFLGHRIIVIEKHILIKRDKQEKENDQLRKMKPPLRSKLHDIEIEGCYHQLCAYLISQYFYLHHYFH